MRWEEAFLQHGEKAAKNNVDIKETDIIHWEGKKYRILSIDLDRNQMKNVIITELIDE